MMKLHILTIIQVLLIAIVISSTFQITIAKRKRQKNPELQRIFGKPKTPFIYSNEFEENHREQEEEEENYEYSYSEYFFQKAEELLSKQKYKLAIRKFKLAAIFGHKGAIVTLAILNLSGENIKRNLNYAIKQLKLAEQYGHPNAHSILGILNASGLLEKYGISKSIKKSLVYWTISSGSNNIYSSSALGFRHLYGIGVDKNCLKAAKYYRISSKSIATDNRYWPSAFNFVESKPPLPAGMYEASPTRLDSYNNLINNNNQQQQNLDSHEQDLVHYYRDQANNGNHVARTILGALYYFGGNGIDPDENEARNQLTVAARQNNGEARTILGHLDMRARKNQSAFEHFMYGAGFHVHNSHYALGMIFKYGLLGKEIDLSKAKMHFELAINLKPDHAGANFQLGMIYWNGKGGVDTKDGKKAFEFFQKAADSGNIQSKFNIGNLLTRQAEKSDNDVERMSKCQKGVKYLKEVAEEGQWKTVLELAYERVEKKDWFGALHRYLQAAHAGIELAQFNAAYLLEALNPGEIKEIRHWNRRRMLKEARELYTFSAKQGHTDSLIRCAKAMYVEMKDYIQAANIFREASDLGSAEGMVSLGLMYARGKGVAQSRIEALRYLETASGMGEDAVAPATVGIIFVRVYWILEDLWKKLNSWSSSQEGLEKKTEEDSGEALKLKVEGDMAALGLLVIALVTVLVVRFKRVARRPDAGDEVSEGERN